MDHDDPDTLETRSGAQSANAKRSKPRRPRKMSAQRLHAIALAYLDRYEASEASFRAMLERRVFKSAKAHDEDPDRFADMIEAEVEKAISAGLIDNRRFAENQVYRQRSRGASSRAIAARLKGKGIDADLIDHALESDDRSDEAAAWRYAQRRRLGPFRTHDREARRERDMAALCRAGFSFSLAAQIVDGDPDERTL